MSPTSSRLFTTFCLGLLTLSAVARPAQAKNLTVRSEARVIAPSPEERQLTEFLAELRSMRLAREQALPLLKQYKAFQHEGLDALFLEAMANTYLQRYLSYYDESSAWEGRREIRYKTKLEYETLNFPEKFELLYQRDYGNILLSKYMIQESNALEQRLQDYLNKLASSSDPDFRQLLRQSEGKKLRTYYQAGELMEEAMELLKREDLERAQKKLKRAYQLIPDSKVALLLNAFTHLGLKEYDDSQRLLTEQIKRTPDSDLYLLRGIFYLIENINLKQAQSDLKFVVQQDPQNGLAHLMHGAVLASLNRRIEAERSLQEACDVGIKNACDANVSDFRLPQQQKRPQRPQP